MKQIIEGIDRNWDTTAPVEVRKCCENYDHTQGCLFLPKCIAPKCRHYQEVVLKVAVIEGAMTSKKIEKAGGMVRTCPDCEKPLSPRERYCGICRIKRSRSSKRLHINKIRSECR